MNKKGQFSSFDIVIILVSITIFIALTATFIEDKAINTESKRIRNDYTHSLLLSMLYCTVNDSSSGKVYENKTISDLLVMYFLNPKEFNITVERKVKAHLEKYFEDKTNVEWVLYGSKGEKVLWIPQGKILSGKFISSSSVELILPNDEGSKVRIFLWIKWG
jgi:hypothetical protein